MAKSTQISAEVSAGTKELLDRLVRRTGLKKGFVVETALRHHLLALQELPADVIVPARTVVSRRSAGKFLKRLTSPGEPSPDLRRLMSRRGH